MRTNKMTKELAAARQNITNTCAQREHIQEVREEYERLNIAQNF